MRRCYPAATAGSGLVLLFLASSCGYVGAPLTPLANVPAPISDLTAAQRGDSLLVRCTLPTHTTEAQLIRAPLKLDLRIGTASEQFNAEDWASRAVVFAAAQVEHGIATWRIPVADWVGKEVVLGVRAVGANGKTSGWSNYQVVPVVAPPAVPRPPSLETVASGVHVTWTGNASQYRVLRRAAEEQAFTAAATGPDHEWTDTGTEYGKLYAYRMQALIDLGNQKVAESELSDIATITPQDKFPPAAPAGLKALAGPSSIELGWDRNVEPDLAGYRLYRFAGDGAWQKLADVALPSYSDNAVEHGRTYHYAVSAVDKSGNESARSAAVDIVL